ncbi:group II truncated hemoglobin [Echinimonas agarilytica]|uniref:Group II truncated hemoglobin n=1 Tax=Echinimonas agarilytica TaxID=1215918 RepID=A0AA42B5W6_9GAMM|nr:group II truncated hemoglobin [Echinimonas agarilytica]MCM2678054.1 group II truncated hemoglobin [Echinimonas agarilytica]
MKWFKSKSQPEPIKEAEPEPSSLYKSIGGEDGVRALANAFYDQMEQRNEAKELLAIHPQPMDSIRQRFFEFLSGWLGGPPLFEQKYGHPRLRARHLSFKIDEQMRDQWMLCMVRALDQVVTCPLTKMQLRHSFYQLADHMRNTD